MIWFTSDLHFGHKQILSYCPRPWETLDQMHNGLIENWNDSVQEDDEVFILGDLALCGFQEFSEYCRALRGKKYLIKGNHDKYSNGQYNRLGIKVFHEVKMLIAGHTVRLSHYPYAPEWYRRPFVYKSELRFLERRPPRIAGEILLHGHTHTRYKRAGNRIHVGVDAWDYRPASAREIESLISKPV